MELRDSHNLRPTQKIRGFRRYVRELRAEAEAFSLPLEHVGRIDMWHHHFDWQGFGVRNGTLRRVHLEALFVAFERALVQASTTQFQVFVAIAPADHAEQDALYYHRPAPNHGLQPHLYPGVVWDVAPPGFLRPFVEGKPWQVGVSRGENGNWWIVRATEA